MPAVYEDTSRICENTDFEIYYDDLTAMAQERLLKFLNLPTAEDGNLNTVPIAVLEGHYSHDSIGHNADYLRFFPEELEY